MNYNYDQAEAAAKANGLELMKAEPLQDFDQQAQAFGFTQAQVDMVFQHHMRHIAWLFTPSNYTWKMRLAIAVLFLFGKGKKNG